MAPEFECEESRLYQTSPTGLLIPRPHHAEAGDAGLGGRGQHGPRARAPPDQWERSIAPL